VTRADLTNAREIDITVTGRRSGREISHPVWFAQDEDMLYLLPVYGSDTQWFKNLRKNPTIRIAADGTELTAQASPIADSARVEDVEQRFRAKYGDANVERYYPKRDVAIEVPLV
jgi:deazaflavin-dependent oxidoreductase (nitroreductase family)